MRPACELHICRQGEVMDLLGNLSMLFEAYLPLILHALLAMNPLCYWE